ncbi:MED24 isoform 2, partial [Pan troglodytes]
MIQEWLQVEGLRLRLQAQNDSRGAGKAPFLSPQSWPPPLPPAQSEIMKVVNLKQAILQAWKERWSDYQWAINMKKFFPKGATWDILNLADALLEQAMIGPSPNPLILSYLKYAISSQMVSYSSVLTAISKFDDFSRDLCVQALLDIMDMFCDRLSCHGKAEECIGLCRALLSALHW